MIAIRLIVKLAWITKITPTFEGAMCLAFDLKAKTKKTSTSLSYYSVTILRASPLRLHCKSRFVYYRCISLPLLCSGPCTDSVGTARIVQMTVIVLSSLYLMSISQSICALFFLVSFTSIFFESTLLLFHIGCDLKASLSLQDRPARHFSWRIST